MRMQSVRFYGGVLIVTASTMMLQVIQTRILSVMTWFYLAFFVVSIAMFGLTAGAVWVYVRRERFTTGTLSYDLAYFSGVFAITAALALAYQTTLAPVVALTTTAMLIWAQLAVCIAVPFFFSGVVVSLALTRSPYPIGRVYGVDLAGAALGCLGVLGILNYTDGFSAVLWVSAFVALGALLFAGSGIGTAPQLMPPCAWAVRRPGLMLLVLGLCAMVNGLGSNGLYPIFIKGKTELPKLFEQWNSFSRVTVHHDFFGRPHLWGPSPKLWDKDWQVLQRGMTIDGDACTTTYFFDNDLANVAFLKYDVTNLAYFLPDQKRAAIIGTGGGRDMLAARVFGVPAITGIEVNPILVRLLTQDPGYTEFSGLTGLGGMTFEVDEARSWFARTEQTFDVVQMSLIDTWAATGAGAFTLSENGLYTVEAWRLFLTRLTQDGVFTVSRWYAPGEADELSRLMSLAVATLFELGASEPRQHLFVAASGRIATLVLSRSPFTPSRLAALEDAASNMAYTVQLSPNTTPASEILRNILASRSRTELERYTSNLELDHTPPTDERPFFFNLLPLYNPLKTLRLALHSAGTGIEAGNVRAIATLSMLFSMSAILVCTTIVVPLRTAVRDVGRKLAMGGTAYFFLIGMGFMSAEIGLLQRMSVFLGHPTYALSIVLFSMILTTGVGSMLSDTLPLRSHTPFVIWSLASGVYLGALPFWLPSALAGFESAALLLRAGLCILVILPAGVLMGYGFPTGMRLVTSVDHTPTPWFWGINGAAGVLASTIAVACSIAFGIGTTLTVGALCYVLLIPAAGLIGFHHELQGTMKRLPHDPVQPRETATVGSNSTISNQTPQD